MSQLDAREEAVLSGETTVAVESPDEPDAGEERSHERGDLHEAVLEDAEERGAPVAGLTHEHNAHLLFADDDLEDGMRPFFELVSAFEPRQTDDEGDTIIPALADVPDFEAAGSTWSVDRRSDHEQPGEYEKGIARYWPGGIATRPSDSGETYYEYQIPVYDTDDEEKRNRRITFQFRPALPEATTADGTRIGSMPADLPHGIRVEVNSSYVDTDDVVPVLQGLAGALGLRRDYFAPEHIHEWSNVYGLAVYVRVLRDLADDLLVGPDNGLLSRLADFGSARKGRGEHKWNNGDVFGQRTHVVMNPVGLNKLYGDHRVGKLLKSYLLQFASRTANDPEVEPTDHPKLECQWNREYTPDDITVRWRSEHAAADELDRHALETELRTFLLNALQWAGFPLVPDNDEPPVYVEDHHFTAEQLDADQVADLHLVDCPLDQAVERERNLVTRELLQHPPTDAEEDVLRASTDGGQFDDVRDLADAAGRSSSTVSRTLSKFERLFERVDGVAVADTVVRDRLAELFKTLDSAIDRVERGLSHLGSGDKPVDEDSPFGRWADRYGATFVNDVQGLRLRIAAGNFSLYELRTLLRSGYEAARQTVGLDEMQYLSASVEYYDEDGDRADALAVASWHGNSLKILGGEDVFALR